MRHRVPNTGLRRQVHDDPWPQAGEQFAHRIAVGQLHPFDATPSGVSSVSTRAAFSARIVVVVEVVAADHVQPLSAQARGHMGADKARCSGDEDGVRHRWHLCSGSRIVLQPGAAPAVPQVDGARFSENRCALERCQPFAYGSGAMKITIIGTGYVGLVTGACLAEMGNDVLCLDIDARKIAMLQRAAACRSTSRGCGELVAAQRRSAAACSSPPTSTAPSRTARAVHRRRHAARRGRLGRPAARARPRRAHIGQRMTDYKVVVDKSTVPVGTADRVRADHREALRRARRAIDFVRVVSNPEFLKEGAAVDDFMQPDRVVVGSRRRARDAADARAVRAVRAQPRPRCW